MHSPAVTTSDREFTVDYPILDQRSIKCTRPLTRVRGNVYFNGLLTTPLLTVESLVVLSANSVFSLWKAHPNEWSSVTFCSSSFFLLLKNHSYIKSFSLSLSLSLFESADNILVIFYSAFTWFVAEYTWSSSTFFNVNLSLRHFADTI